MIASACHPERSGQLFLCFNQHCHPDPAVPDPTFSLAPHFGASAREARSVRPVRFAGVQGSAFRERPGKTSIPRAVWSNRKIVFVAQNREYACHRSARKIFLCGLHVVTNEAGGNFPARFLEENSCTNPKPTRQHFSS